MTTSNTIVVAEVRDALSIPLESIHPTDSLSYVIVKRGGKLIRQEIQLGLIGDNEAIVEAGLEETDRLVLSSVENLDRLDLVQIAAL
jgi:hypothetical protein